MTGLLRRFPQNGTLTATALIVTSLLLTAGCSRDAPRSDQGSERGAVGARPLDARPGPIGIGAGGGPGQPIQLAGARSVSGPRVQIFPGTGVVAGTPAGPGAPGAVGEISLNFVGADVRDVLRAVLGELLGENFVVDPRVQGPLTLQTHRPLPRSSLMQVLDDVLRLNGLAMVRSGDVLSIIPSSDGRAQAAAVTAGLRVVPLSFVSAAEMTAMLRGLVPSETVVRPIPSRNVLLVGGAPRDVAAALDLVSVFDVDWLAGMSTALYKPRSKDARTLRAELTSIVGGDRTTAGAVRLIAMPSLNAVLAVARSPQLLRQIGTWVERLDQAADTAEQRIFIYNVQHGRATELAAILSRLFGVSVGGAQGAASSVGATSPPQEQEQRIEVSGRQGGAGRGGAFPPAPRVPGSDGSLTGRPPADASQGGAALGPVDAVDVPGPGPTADQGDARIKVIADEGNNALIVLSSPSEFRMIESALEKLDVAPLQVLIEAAVAEVTLTDELRYGVQWFLRSGKFATTLSNSGSGLINQIFPGFTAVFSNLGINVVLSALDAVTDVRVVSSPSIMVLNNRTANLMVGDQIPIATQQAVSTEVDPIHWTGNGLS